MIYIKPSSMPLLCKWISEYAPFRAPSLWTHTEASILCKWGLVFSPFIPETLAQLQWPCYANEGLWMHQSDFLDLALYRSKHSMQMKNCIWNNPTTHIIPGSIDLLCKWRSECAPIRALSFWILALNALMQIRACIWRMRPETLSKH